MKSNSLLATILEEDLAEPNLKDRHRVAFLALRDQIEEALNGGATAKRIWSRLKTDGKLQCSYQTFSRYINRFIDGTTNTKQINTKPNNKLQPQTPMKAKTTDQPSVIKEVKYNPSIDMKDLF